MKIDIVKFVPKFIDEKKLIVGLPGMKFSIGKKIKSFEGEIRKVKIKKINEKENPQFKILKALSITDMTFDELIEKTGLSYENLRSYLLRKNTSLLKENFVRIKERKTYLYKNINGGCVKIIWMITNEGREKLSSINKKIILPKRKELILINSNGKEFVLSSWWSSWLKPNAKDLEFNKDVERFLWKIPMSYILLQYEKTVGALYSVILPKEIEVDDEIFVTSLGLLLGEMRKRKGGVSFSNTESNLANYVLKFFEYFGLNKYNFVFNIQINTKNLEINKNRLINYWSKELNIGKNKISNIFEYKDYGTKRTEFGRIDFIYWNVMFKEIINNLINYSLKKAQKNKNCAIYLIRGLLASEGCVSPSHSGSLGRVEIGSESDKNKTFMKKILENLDIICSVRNNALRITSRDNFDKIIKYDLLKISKDREKFKVLYNKFKYNKDKLIAF